MFKQWDDRCGYTTRIRHNVCGGKRYGTKLVIEQEINSWSIKLHYKSSVIIRVFYFSFPFLYFYFTYYIRVVASFISHFQKYLFEQRFGLFFLVGMHIQTIALNLWKLQNYVLCTNTIVYGAYVGQVQHACSWTKQKYRNKFGHLHSKYVFKSPHVLAICNKTGPSKALDTIYLFTKLLYFRLQQCYVMHSLGLIFILEIVFITIYYVGMRLKHFYT